MALNFANNNSLSAITTLPASISGGGMTLISEQTASSSANLSFTSGIDSTYDSYVFKFINIHSSGNDVGFTFNGSVDSGSNYNITKTTSTFLAIHNESDSFTGLSYNAGGDLAQSTAFQRFMVDGGNGDGNDESLVSTLQLFNPSSTTFVKHFIITSQANNSNDYSNNTFVAGYFNTTSAVDGIRFQMTSGNIDSGVIKLYGIS